MKRVGAILLAVVLGTSALATPMPAPPGTVVSAPAWEAGSEWYFSDGYALKVTSVSPQGTVFDRIDAPGQWFSRQGFIRKDSASASATRNGIYRTIGEKDGYSLSAAAPLTFQREYLSNGTLMVHASSWTVEGRETITVPAGTFDCWLIVWRTRSMRSDWTGFERWWYSPVAQQYVRMEYKYGPGAEGSRVLMRYHIGPATAPLAPASVPMAEAPGTKPVVLAPVSPPPAPAPTTMVTPAETHKTATADPPRKSVLAPAPEAVEKSATPEPVIAAAQQKPAPAAPAMPDKPSTSPRMAAAIPAAAGGVWHAQVGSSKDEGAMHASLQKLLSGNAHLAALPNGVTAHDVKGRGTFYRAWIGAFDRQGEAQSLCSSLKSCAVFKTQTKESRSD